MAIGAGVVRPQRVAPTPPRPFSAAAQDRDRVAVHRPDEAVQPMEAQASSPVQVRLERSEREAARRGFFGTYEDYGKLLNALEARDADEGREMAIWFPKEPR